eukprot:TRINITY_DN21705_c0_g1_i1.p1 TRINITY_DN21705_c0_g1~~TRINITY_DN21705_c0_g1_i1.p1  ORF type:complete len:224 (-),score=28.06 TRINITY_DN21705_c0_g1_i1:118-705(-)
MCIRDSHRMAPLAQWGCHRLDHFLPPEHCASTYRRTEAVVSPAPAHDCELAGLCKRSRVPQLAQIAGQSINGDGTENTLHWDQSLAVRKPLALPEQRQHRIDNAESPRGSQNAQPLLCGVLPNELSFVTLLPQRSLRLCCCQVLLWGVWAATGQELVLPPRRSSHQTLSLIHISEPTRLLSISYAVFCLKKKKRL